MGQALVWGWLEMVLRRRGALLVLMKTQAKSERFFAVKTSTDLHRVQIFYLEWLLSAGGLGNDALNPELTEGKFALVGTLWLAARCQSSQSPKSSQNKPRGPTGQVAKTGSAYLSHLRSAIVLSLLRNNTKFILTFKQTMIGLLHDKKFIGWICISSPALYYRFHRIQPNPILSR